MPTPNKTVYVRNEDVELWEKAEKMAGGSLSGLIADVLRKFIREKELAEKGFKRIEVDTVDGPKAFVGKWIVEKGSVCVAETKKGNVVVYTGGAGGKGNLLGNLEVYNSLEEALENAPSTVRAFITEALGEREGGHYVEEMDI